MVLDDIFNPLSHCGTAAFISQQMHENHGMLAPFCSSKMKKRQVDSGLGFATAWRTARINDSFCIANGHSKWAYNYQIKHNGSLMNKAYFLHPLVHNWQDDAGAESVCCSIKGRQFPATKSSIQISADDGLTQVILPAQDNARATGVAIGGRDLDPLFAFCGNRI